MSISQGLQEAISDSKRREVMQEEMRALRKNNTWELVEHKGGMVAKSMFTVEHKALLKLME